MFIKFEKIDIIYEYSWYNSYQQREFYCIVIKSLKIVKE